MIVQIERNYSVKASNKGTVAIPHLGEEMEEDEPVPELAYRDVLKQGVFGVDPVRLLAGRTLLQGAPRNRVGTPTRHTVNTFSLRSPGLYGVVRMAGEGWGGI